MRSTSPVVLLTLLGSIADAQTIVVPSSQQVFDGPSRIWVAGTIRPWRQLTLIDEGHLLACQGHSLQGISFRRNAENLAFASGSANLSVYLSHAARNALQASTVFADNHGPDRTLVFQGSVAVAPSPAVGSNTVAWTPANTIAIPFQVPFSYQGGPLALEVTGSPDPLSTLSWWPADAVWIPDGVTPVSVGNGSGGYGGPNGEWSYLSLGGPGAAASFRAFGAPGELGLLALATGTQAQRIDLSVFGVPGSYLHILDPFEIRFALFGSLVFPQVPAAGGLAAIDITIPPETVFLGVSLGSQWFRLDATGLLSASNAHQWSISSQLPSLGLSMVSAPVIAGEPPVGRVVQACGHVVRFDYQ